VKSLKLSIRKDALNEAIGHVSRAVSPRPVIPILAGIKIDADSRGITLTASDTDISVQSFIPLEEDGETIVRMESGGSLVLGAKFFSEIVRKLPTDTVELEAPDVHRAIIRSGNAEIELVGLDPEEYPVLPSVADAHTFSINGLKMKQLVQRTVFAVSANESTPILTGVLWQLSGGKLKLTATDRHRLSNAECEVAADPELKLDQMVIAGRTLNELSKLVPDNGTMIEVAATESQVLFRMDRILFYSRLLDGTYPDTSRIITNQYKTEMIMSTKALTDAIERAYLLSREEKTNIVRMATVGSGEIEVSSSSLEIGKVTERIVPDHLAGEELKIAFNSRYMLDALKVIDQEKIHIGFTGAMSPILIRPEQEPDMLHLILPYRTTT
jgi:DNA polymerase-3 subunit beta